MTRDLTALAANRADASTAELEHAVATARAVYARIGFFPDRRRVGSRAHFAVVDELATRQTTGAEPSPDARVEGGS